MIEFDHVSKIYNGNKVAVEDVNLSFNKGEFICLIGTSGSGKTTTMRMINRMIDPTKGTIRINGEDIQKKNPVELRRQIGYVIQNIGLMPHMTIRDNITLVQRLLKVDKEEQNKTAEKMIDLVELPRDMLDRYPHELSGGQQQRIGVVRALAADQDVILMDEPSMGLSPILVEEIFHIIREISAGGTTVLLVEQNAKKALAIADRAYVLETGNIVLSGDAKEMMNNDSIKKAYLGE